MSKTKVLKALLCAKVLTPPRLAAKGLKNVPASVFKFSLLLSFIAGFPFPLKVFAQTLLVNVDFSTNDNQSSNFYHNLYKETGEPWSFTISDKVDRNGNPSGRFELRYGDKKEGGSTRTEISYNNIKTSEVWVGFSLYLPNSWSPDKEEELTGQLHTWDTLNKKADINPPVSILHGNGFTYVKLVYSLNERPYLNKVRITDTLGKTITGQWIDYIIHVKYDVNNGFAQVWQNGKLVVNYSGPLGYKHCRLPVIKFGIYKWPWTETGPSDVSYRVAYYDNIKIAGSKGSYDLVVPTPIKANKPPAAEVKKNELTIILPTNSVTLNGSASHDSDGKIVSYQWEQVSGPSISVISDPNASQTKVTGLKEGKYVFELTVKDNQGTTSTSQTIVTVNPKPNKPPVAKVKKDKLIITLPNDSVMLNGSSSSDSDGKIVSYQWEQKSGPSASTIADVNTAKTKVTDLKAGKYVFELTIKDNDGATSTSQTTVNAHPSPNKPPVAKVEDNALTITLPKDSTTLDGRLSKDSDGKIVSYRWEQKSGPSISVIIDATSAQTKVAGLKEGTYTFQLKVTDNKNATSTAEITAKVNPDPDKAQDTTELPVTSAGRDTTIPVQRPAAPSFILYPNPASDITHIRLCNQWKGKMIVTIYDENGIIRQRHYFNKDQEYFDQRLDVSQLIKGVNFVQVQIKSYTSTSKLLKIQ